MKKIFKAACVLAIVLFVPSFVSAQDDVEVYADSAQIAYLQSIDDRADVNRIITEQQGPMILKETKIQCQNLEDSTKIDSISLTEKVCKLHGAGVFVGATASVIADGGTYQNGSIGDHFSFRPEFVFGFFY